MRHRKKKKAASLILHAQRRVLERYGCWPEKRAIEELAAMCRRGEFFLSPRAAVIDEIEDRREAKWTSFPIDLRQEASLRHNGADNGYVVGRRTDDGCRGGIFRINQRKEYHKWKEYDSSRFQGRSQRTMKICNTAIPEISSKDAKKK